MFVNNNKDLDHFFRVLVTKYNSKVIRFISLFVKDKSSCEELASDVFVSLWMHWNTIHSIKNLDNYIFITAKNKALNYLRNEQKTVDIDLQIVDVFHHTKTTPESIFLSNEIVQELNAVINKLPHRTKLAFLLVREQNKTYKEAAEILSVSEKTIEKQVASAVKQLKEYLITRNSHLK